MFNVVVIGATGYVGAEIVRLLQYHPEISISCAVSRSFAGKPYSNIYPNLKKIFDMPLSTVDMDSLCEKADFFITALPHDVSKDIIPKLINEGKRVIDHSALFRFRKRQTYEQWYGTAHGMEDLLENSVYGLPEFYRDNISQAKLVANPGCYPTCAILGIAPLLANKLVYTTNIIIDAASGISGAGRKSDLVYSFCETHENFKAYGITNHRHTPEIEQELSLLTGEDIMISFTPHLLPIKRGILTTSYLNLKDNNLTSDKLYEVYSEYYKNEFFVRVLEPGVFPEIKNVTGSNFIDIGVTVDKRLNRAVIVSAVDNLGKGAAGQAIQCLNLMLGIDEKTGLTQPALYL